MNQSVLHQVDYAPVRASMPERHTEWRWITPVMATEWLAISSDNNRENPRWITELAAMMTNGQFKPTHQGIFRGKGGCVLDGRNRLRAVERSGVTIMMLVTSDETVSSVKNLPVDLGMKRHGSFIYAETKQVIAVANFVGKLVKGRPIATMELRPYIEMIKPSVLFLSPPGKKTARRIFSAAPVLLAACVHLKLSPENRVYYFDTYHALCRQDPKELAPKPYSFWRQMTQETTVRATDLYTKAIRAFDYQTRELSRLTYKNTELAWDEAVQMAKLAFPIPYESPLGR